MTDRLDDIRLKWVQTYNYITDNEPRAVAMRSDIRWLIEQYEDTTRERDALVATVDSQQGELNELQEQLEAAQKDRDLFRREAEITERERTEANVTLEAAEKERDYVYHLLDESIKRTEEAEARVELMERLVRWHYPNTERALIFARTLPPITEDEDD